MCLNHETVLPGHFLLQPFNFTILEFDDGSATGTNEVVVVAFVRDVVVLRLGTEMSCLGNPGFAEQVQGTIDGGQSQVGVLFGELVVHRLRRDMFLSQERCKNQLALTR